MSTATVIHQKSNGTAWLLPALLGAIHFLSDFSAGLIIGTAASVNSRENLSIMVLMYNVIAFGLQPLAGILSDRFSLSRLFVYIGLITGPASLLLFEVSPWLSILIAGIGSAVFHVGGGALSITADENKSVYIGVFLSPGVIGLALGGYSAFGGIFPILPLAGLFLILLTAFFLVPAQQFHRQEGKQSSFVPDKHDVIMIIILLAIAFRSAVWNVFQYISAGDFAMLIPIALSAGMGKVTGGLIADYLGKRIWIYISLTFSILFLALSEYSRYFLFAGIFFLQSTSPVAIRILADAYRKIPATIAGLSIGFAIALGALPHYFRMQPMFQNFPPISYMLIAVSGGLLLYSLARLTRRFKTA